MSAEIKLLPCPFCGGEAEIKYNSRSGCYEERYCRCKGCKARMEPYSITQHLDPKLRIYVDDGQASAKCARNWNTRTPPTSTPKAK